MNEMQVIRVHFWAAARSAAGRAEQDVPVTAPISLAQLRARIIDAHPGSRLSEVLAVCSVMVGDQPVSSRSPEDVVVGPGDVVEFLPPFAGG